MAVFTTLVFGLGCVAAVLAARGLPGATSLAIGVCFLLPVVAWGWRLRKVRRSGVIRPFPIGQWLLRVCLSRLLPLRLLWMLLWRLTPAEAHRHLEELFEPDEFERSQDPVRFRRAFLEELKVFALLSLLLVGGFVGGAVDAAEHLGFLPAGTSPYGREPAHEAARPAALPMPRTEVDVQPFTAVRFARGERWLRAEAVAQFTLAGFDSETAQPVDRRVAHVAADPASNRVFAITAHDFGTVAPATGEFEEIVVDPSLAFSWPRGIARDPVSGRIVVLTSHVFSRLYRFDPEAGDWERLPTELRDLPLVGLAWWPEHESFYALEIQRNEAIAPRIHRFDRQGAHLGSVPLDPPVPLGSSSPPSDGCQLVASSGGLVVMLPPDSRRGPFLIDPESGRVAIPRH